MSVVHARRPKTSAGKTENIAYIRHMLAELRTVALAEECDMLCYLIEMAYLEAGDVETGRHAPTPTSR